MATWNELHAAALREPEEDAPRLALADYYRPNDPDRARFMELQIRLGVHRRTRTELPPHALEYEVEKLLKKHDERWSSTIAKYTRGRGGHRYDRGMIDWVWIDPYVFLEYGDWLRKNAPIRRVSFWKRPGDELPLAELLESDVIAGLDQVGFDDIPLTDADVEKIAASPKLRDLLSLGLGDGQFTRRAFEAIAASPHLRALLYINRPLKGPDWPYSPIADHAMTEEDDAQGRAIWKFRPLPPDGIALEKKHGYLPWLHPKDNSRSDLRYRVQRGELPVKPRGSPV